MVLLDYVVLAVYFLLMAAIGIICMRGVKGQDEYFLGSRGFGKLLQTFAAFGAGTGSSDPVNTGRTTFTSGMSGMWSVMYWLFVTPFYWITAVWYRRMRHTTLGDWFAERYESRLLGAMYAVFGIFFMTVYGSMMFSAIGKVAAPLVGTGTFQLGSQMVGIEYLLVPIIGIIVLVYGTAGGLRAAYWTDLIQGLCIILLSLLLIPFGLSALVEKFGDPDSMGMLDGFRIMHEQVSPEYFSVIGSTSTSEFPLHFIVAVVVINLITIVVQPHFILTGGGSAKDENSARYGLVVGNFLKRFCTIGWVLTALIILALYADSPELAEDPDRTWGVASRELLGPGLSGLMLACLLAALMSSIDVYMIVGSALVVRNVYVAFVRPDATESQCLLVARLTGIVIVGGSVLISLSIMDVFAQLQLTWIVLAPIAAPFWIGMYWRRATTTAAWTTVVFCGLSFFLIPLFAPIVIGDLDKNPAFTQVTPVIETTTVHAAAPADVARRQAAISVWDEAKEALAGEANAQAGIDSLGSRPEPIELGERISETTVTGGQSLFWTGRVVPIDETGSVMADITQQPVSAPSELDENTTRVVKRYDASQRLQGTGQFKFDFLLYKVLGIDLSEFSDSTLRTLDLPPKIIIPFLVMIVVSWFTTPNSKTALDRYYAKMKTPVRSDPAQDAAELERSYLGPESLSDRKLWPNSNIEIQKPTRADVIGFVLSVAACFGIIGLAVLVTSIGA